MPSDVGTPGAAVRQDVGRTRRRVLRQFGKFFGALLIVVTCAHATGPTPAQIPPSVPTTQETPKDTLGRSTPRGAVLGFLSAARKDNAEIAALYLNTPLRGEEAQNLARQLWVVIDRRLPARLNEISDKPEGGMPDPLRPDEDVVGTIKTRKGEVEIRIERVDRGKMGKVWLFSRQTLNSVPDLYSEISAPAVQRFVPEIVLKTRVFGVSLIQLLAFFLGLPLLYGLTGLLNRLLGSAVGALKRRIRSNPDLKNPRLIPVPGRLLLLAVCIRFLLGQAGLSFLARQFWSTAALVIAIAAIAWLLILLNSYNEFYLLKRRGTATGSASVLRLLRRSVDGIILFAALLFTLHHFGVNVTAAMAGLGVGGIAIALAAQKTLENVIAGVSLIADEAVRVGDTLKFGEIVGTVEEVGLRSTRVRTADRTVVILPNGQLANLNLEALSARDKYWFHPVVGLRYQTTATQLRSITSAVHRCLDEHASVESSSVRVRFIRFGACSLDVEIFAYLFARDWNDFLLVQEELLLNIMEIVENAGAEMAFPSQTMYLAADSVDPFPWSKSQARRKQQNAQALSA